MNVEMPELLLEEAAALLQKTPKQLRWTIYRGTAPRSARIGGRRMFRAEDIAAYVDDAFEEGRE